MPLGRCMRTHTERQLALWLVWIKEEFNVPSRSEFYLMQIAAEVRRSNVKNPRKVKPQDFLLKFNNDKPRPVSKEWAVMASKARWISMMTAPIKRVTIPAPPEYGDAGGH